jgi:type II secretory pathway pseudopilin PulG
MHRFRRIIDRACRPRDDEGYTLVELLIASSLLVGLSTLVMVSMSSFITIGTSVSAQYQEYDNELPAVASVRPVIHAEAEPGPATATGAPTPGFGVSNTSVSPNTISGIGNYSLTFYADTGYTYGPVKIVAQLTTPSGTAVTPSTTTCILKSPCNFQVQEYLPTYTTSGSVNTSTCPGIGTGPACVYSTTYKLLTNVQYVVNSPTQPVFSYVIFDPTTSPTNTFVLTAAQVTAMAFPVPTATYGISTANLAQCKPASGSATLAVTCPADAIQRVGVDVQVKVPGDQSGSNDEIASLVYRDQGSSTSPNLPYQYSSTVG